MIAEIITIGDEILIGQIVDTNSAWIAEKLNLLGVKVSRIISISDSKNIIHDALNESFHNNDVTIITGGLGPTNDDITKGVLTDFFKGNLILHEPTLEHITTLFNKRGLPLTELNRKQAEVPDSCLPLFNKLGTAPGMWFEKDQKIIVSLPGVPFEMKGLMEDEVLPRLKILITDEVIVHRTIQTFGLPESFLAEKLAEWESQLPLNIKLAYLPSPLSIRLRLSAYGSANMDLNIIVQKEIDKLYKVIPKYIFGEDDVTMQQVVGQMLKSSGSTLSLAESCTGGTIAHLITHVPESSAYFQGGIVAYSNKVKEEILGVDPNLISKHGAVSKEVVEAMAKGVKEKLKTDFAIAVSGIAGPGGGSKEKPVGTIWIAVISNKSLIVKDLKFGSDRQRNIMRSSVTALNMLRLMIIDENL